MRFYANTTSQIEVLMDGHKLLYTFPLLPYCRIPSGKHKRQFLGRINRVTAQSK
jgi:hypothetical protein